MDLTKDIVPEDNEETFERLALMFGYARRGGDVYEKGVPADRRLGPADDLGL